MGFLTEGIVALVAMGAGLATLAGLRALLPLALVGIISSQGFLDAFELDGTSFAVLESQWVIGVLLALAVAEIAAEKVPLIAPALDIVAAPVRVIAGAVVFGAALAQQETGVIVAGMIAGGAIAGITHALKMLTRPDPERADAGGSGPFLSLFVDVAVALGTFAIVAIPIIGLFLVAFVIYLTYRVRRRRRRKYKGLRILRD